MLRETGRHSTNTNAQDTVHGPRFSTIYARRKQAPQRKSEVIMTACHRRNPVCGLNSEQAQQDSMLNSTESA